MTPLLRRWSRGVIVAVTAAMVALPISGAADPTAVPAPPPPVLGPITATSDALAERYAANRTGIIEAAELAGEHGHRHRAEALTAMADPERRFLSFDGRDGGLAVEVYGDLATASSIAVLVPGADTSVDRFRRLANDAAALHAELDDGAVIAWLGYRPPRTISLDIVASAPAEKGAPALIEFVGQLRTARPDATVSTLCHSYGSVVCGKAAEGLDVSNLVFYGSPGVGVDTASDLNSSATVWAGRGGGDWLGDVQLLMRPLGFGIDPISPAFGARIFDAGEATHSTYLAPGTESLAGLAAIVSGDVDA
ncbi:alpha/beta hydrolase family protein [Stackebrandtia endophytica]|uniref:Alpha/beta hydrolase family protein n=1 Tax=Stackebrandtia endophytica TaxID=1496996 RepID=A0A543B2L6_9ACTN|nr:alpha/beta hydrolase [Stackebrandtia endophytica]TQL79077.1 alpha/beta hydrolase family protein [Stackebrandtia endophytica]